MLHGEVSCYTSKPKCSECPLQSICPAAKSNVQVAAIPSKMNTKSIRVFKIFPTSGSIRFVNHQEDIAFENALVFLDTSEEARLRRVIGLRHHRDKTRFIARLFVTPESVFSNTFPMRGTHFLPNEVFLHSQRVSIDLESFLRKDKKKSNRLCVRIIQLGASAKSLYANTLPKRSSSSCRVFTGKFVCLREVTSDRRLDRLDLDFENSRNNICENVLSGLVDHVVRNENNEKLKKQRRVLMRLRRLYVSYLRSMSTMSSSNSSSSISPVKKMPMSRDHLNGVSETMAKMIVQISQELKSVSANRILTRRVLNESSSMEDIVKFQKNISIYALSEGTRVLVRCENNIYYTAIVLKSTRLHECICSLCFENFPVRYDLRVLEVVPEFFKEETEALSKCFRCQNFNYPLCFSECHQIQTISNSNQSFSANTSNQVKLTFQQWLESRKWKWRHLRDDESIRDDESTKRPRQDTSMMRHLDVEKKPIRIEMKTLDVEKKKPVRRIKKKKKIVRKIKTIKKKKMQKKRKRDRIDENLAYEEGIFVRSLNNETLRDVVKRLDLSQSATDLLELNLDRYDGLKLTSKLRSGT